MKNDILSRYLWMIDTLLKFHRLTRKEMSDIWEKSRFSEGNPMPERTFHHYRRGIEELFNIEISCDREGRYYIPTENLPEMKQFTKWILDTNAATTAIQELGTESGRIEIEEMPSSRQFLPIVAEAMRLNLRIVFTYAGFSKSRPDVGILFSPYFLKYYKQRWYMYGKKDRGMMRTYALDRVKEMEITTTPFTMPARASLGKVFDNIVGVTTSQSDVREVVLRTTLHQAKYLRALPLHKSQVEESFDFFSLFRYRLKINYELVSEIMAMGPDVVVVAPRELQLMVAERLQLTLQNYTDM